LKINSSKFIIIIIIILPYCLQVDSILTNDDEGLVINCLKKLSV